MKRPRFDLREIAARSGKAPRKRALRLAPIEPSRALEREGAQIGLRLVARWREIALDLLDAYEAALSVKQMDLTPTDSVTVMDAAGDNLAVLIESGASQMSRYVIALQPDITNWINRIELFQRRKFAAGVKAGLGGTDIFPYLSGSDVQDEIAASIERNVSLIKGLSADLERRTGETVWREYLKQTPRREIGRMLSDQLGVGRSRANLIAKDQTLKLSAQLNQERQEQVGITQYVWRTAQDERVRPTHAERDGKIYEWEDDSEIKPGEEINCRCTAQAYLPPLEEQAQGGQEPEPEVRLAGEEAEAHAATGETAAIEADTERALQLRKAERAQVAAERAVLAAQRQSASYAAKLAQAQSVGLAGMQEELGSRAAAAAAMKAAEEKAAKALAQEKAAKIAATKAQNAVTKLKAMEGASAEIDAISQAAIENIAKDPTSAYAILTKAQGQILKLADKAEFAKEAWLKKYLKGLKGMMAEVGSSSKSSLKTEIANVEEMLAKISGEPLPAKVAATPAEAVASVKPAAGMIPPPEAHGGTFSQAIGMEGKFLSTYGFSSKVLGDPIAFAQAKITSLPTYVLENYQKIEAAFQTWKKTGVLPSPDVLVPIKPPPPPLPPGVRDPKLGRVENGMTQAMRQPKTTKTWEPMAQQQAYTAQDVTDQAYSSTALLAERLGTEHARVWASYKGSGYTTINGELRGGKVAGINAQRLDDLATFKLPGDMLLTRGASVSEFKTIEEALKATSYTDKGFFSTSVDRSTAEGFGGSSAAGKVRVRFTVRAKKGTPVIAGTQGEREFIFARGTKWRVLDTETVPDPYGSQPVVHMLIELW